jgi:hypothetical protein
MPPYFYSLAVPQSYEKLYESVAAPAEPAYAPYTFAPTHTRSPGTRHAILYSSRSDVSHINDMGFLHQTLTGHFGYEPGNITVLNYDGVLKHWPYSSGKITSYANSMPITGPGTKRELEKAFDKLSGLGPDDTLLLHTNNHGSNSDMGMVSILGYSDTEDHVTAQRLGELIAGLPDDYASLVVMMQQCYSGGFIPEIELNSTALET